MTVREDRDLLNEALDAPLVETPPAAKPARKNKGNGKIVEAGKPPRNRVQFAALPYRARDGLVEILLVTSITTRRWIIPKGWPMGERPPHKVAAREAFEEAGVEGKIAKKAIGSYSYDKLLSNGTIANCRVDVFALEVRKQKSTWPERKRRERRWLAVEEAANLVGDAELVPLIRGFAP